MSFEEQQNRKIFNHYQIKLNSNKDYIKIIIQNNNTSNIYESNFNLEYLHKYKLLMGNLTIDEMIEFINDLIDGNDIKVEENENNVKLILISTIKKYPNVELILNKNNSFEQLINEIEGIKNENKILKNNYEIIKNKIELIEEENKKLNLRIELIEKEKNNKIKENNQLEKINPENDEYKNLKIRIDLIEREKEELKNKIKIFTKNNYEEYLKKNEKEKINNEEFLNKNDKETINNEELFKKIELIEKNNEELNNKIEKENEIINKIKNKIKILEGYHLDKIKIQLTKCNLKNINSIQSHKDIITSVSTFPLGNIISVSNDKSIIIYDIHLNILQNIQNAHEKGISFIEVKNENNFITCSLDKSIKLWIKNENKFIINKIINNAHELGIIKVIYCSNGNLISCSNDNKIKIWKENNNNNYENIKILTHSNMVKSILYLEDKNILISCGIDGTKFWNLNKNEINYNNINCIQYFEAVKCGCQGQLCRLDEDRIIIGGYSLKIISILNNKIIKEINIPFNCLGIRLIEDKGIFLIGGKSKDIRVYRNDNYECIQIIQNAHDNYILGLVELKDGSILSYSWDKKIKIWNL